MPPSTQANRYVTTSPPSTARRSSSSKVAGAANQVPYGAPVRFLDAPVLVADVTVQDPKTNQEITLDGDFGMNYLVASIDVNGSDLGNSSAGAFDWIAVGASLGAVSLLDGIHGWLPWLVGPFAATVLYLLIASAQLAIVVVREK